jgi:isopenicillin N synthase-like dioxygenase
MTFPSRTFLLFLPSAVVAIAFRSIRLPVKLSMTSTKTLPSRSPPPTSHIPLIRLSREDDIGGNDGVDEIDRERTQNDDEQQHHHHYQQRTGDGTAFSTTARRVVEALETSGFLLVQSHHLPLDLQQRALQVTHNIFLRDADAATNRDNDDEDDDTRKNDDIMKTSSVTQGVIHHPTDPKSYVMIDCQSGQTIADDIKRTQVVSEQGEVLLMTSYVEAVEKVKVQMLEYIAVGLDLPKEFLVNLHHKRNDALRLLQYHHTTETPQPHLLQSNPKPSTTDINVEQKQQQDGESQCEGKIRFRCKEHSDYGTITLLLTDGKAGLQAFVTTSHRSRTQKDIGDELNNNNNKRKRNDNIGDDNDPDNIDGIQEEETGGWVDVPYVEGALVVNIGSILSRWTNGRLLATLHRVVFVDDDDYDDIVHNNLSNQKSPPMEKTTVRTSLAFFADPNPDVSTNLQLSPDSQQQKSAFSTTCDYAPPPDGNDQGKKEMKFSDYLSWRSGGTSVERTGVAFTSTEEKRINVTSRSSADSSAV